MMTFATLLTVMLPLVDPIVRTVEALFGPKTGAQKFEVVSAPTQTLAEKLVSTGKLPAMPSSEDLGKVIEFVVARMNAGEAAAPVGVESHQQVFVIRGSGVSVKEV